MFLVGCSQDPVSTATPKASSKSESVSHLVNNTTISLPGGASFSIPYSYSSRERDSNYIEIYDQDGIPSVFVTTYNVNEYSPRWISLLPDSVAAAIQFKTEQEELENEKSRELSNIGMSSEIIKWNPPYPLPHVGKPSFGIDYVRHNKSNAMGKHQEGRTYCINIQIFNGQFLYLINLKYISTSETPVDANLPDQYSDIIQSIRIAPEDTPKHNTSPLNTANTATSSIPLRNPSWTTVSIPNICQYQIPPTMELQAGKYRELSNHVYTHVLQILDSERRIVAQQKGLNNMEKDARSRYARVIVEYQPDSNGFAEILNNPLIRDPDVISGIDEEMKSAVFQEAAHSTSTGVSFEISTWEGTQVINVNGVNCLKTTYSRSVEKEPSVSVCAYMIPVKNQILSVTVSYREDEASYWIIDLNSVINTFDFNHK